MTETPRPACPTCPTWPTRPTWPIGRLPALACALLLLLAMPFAGAASAQGQGAGLPSAQNRVQVDLIAEPSTARPGERFHALLRMRVAPGWHTYWMNPGDSGLPTTLEWRLPEGVTAGPLSWPVPKRLPVGPLMNYGYESEVLLPVQISVPEGFTGALLQVTAQADWLVCKDVCIPESATVGFTLPVAPIAALPDPRFAALFTAARAALPGSLPGWTATARVSGNRLQIALRAPEGVAAAQGEVYFFNATEGQVAHAAAQTVAHHRDGLMIEVPLLAQPITPVERMAGLLVAASGFGAGQPAAGTIDAELSADLPDLGPLLATTTVAGAAAAAAAMDGTPGTAQPAAPLGLLLALLLAAVGGIVLNLMPCVFPVLSLKAMSIVGQARSDPGGLRINGLAFGAGVLASFWALAGTLIALRAGGEQVGWGFQLQSPPFVAAMAVLFTLLALNLAGVFEVGSRVASLAGSMPERKGPAGSFFTGVLAVAVAAPCTAPFMGAALGYALAQPAVHALAVFGALAIGMALPYLLLSFVPALAQRLPRPGPWMVTFRQAMVFPLLATVAWLAWVLGLQSGMDAVFGLLAGLVLVALAAWLYGRFAVPSASPRIRAATVVAGALIALAGGYTAWPAATDESAGSSAGSAQRQDAGNAWQAWSADRVAALRAEGRPVFIDFTAAWCVTCQANKQLVLDTQSVRKAFADRDVATLRADWTRRDRAISEALTGYGRSGVPVYVLYLPGRAAPVLLPELLTRDIVLQALSGAGSGAVADARRSPIP
jgi:thiol:disulfide interchange protein DsbD